MSTAADRCAQILTHLTACLSPDSRPGVWRSVWVSAWERKPELLKVTLKEGKKDRRTWWYCVMNVVETVIDSRQWAVVFNCVLVSLFLCICVGRGRGALESLTVQSWGTLEVLEEDIQWETNTHTFIACLKGCTTINGFSSPHGHLCRCVKRHPRSVYVPVSVFASVNSVFTGVSTWTHASVKH